MPLSGPIWTALLSILRLAIQNLTSTALFTLYYNYHNASNAFGSCTIIPNSLRIKGTHLPLNVIYFIVTGESFATVAIAVREGINS